MFYFIFIFYTGNIGAYYLWVFNYLIIDKFI